MSDQESSEPTGERFIPELMGGGLLEAEHQLRYRFARTWVADKRVLDAGCGVGWGSAVLLGAGAAEVVGLDLDREAIADAGTRVPRAEFVVGDLLELPFEDNRYDVVVCFEALEHTGNTDRTLDELARVLAPDGLLFVSSPNPRVYPEGNPFHQNEETPERLLAEVGRRFSQVALFRQYPQIGSVLARDAQDCQSEQLLTAHAISALTPGRDPYSLVVATSGQLPTMDSFAVLTSSEQLDNLATLSEALTAEREEIHRDASGLRSEVARYTRWVAELEAERTRLVEEIHRDDSGLRSEVARYTRCVDELEAERTRLVSEQRESLTQLKRLAESRDRYAVQVLDVEQHHAALQRDHAALQQDHAALQAGIEAVLGSTSWRVTAPLRRLGHSLRRLKR